MQLDEVTEHAKRRGWSLHEPFCDDGISGAHDRRPGFRAMMLAAKRREFDVLLVYRADRLFRSVVDLVQTLDELRALGIEFVSLHEAWDSTTPTGRMMMTIVGAFAEFERATLAQRTRSGLEAAKRRGKTLGRPKRSVDVLRVLELAGRGLRPTAIAARVGVSRATLYRAAASDDRLKNVFASDP